MPRAKETLRVGFTSVANEGTYVSKDAVKEHGWEDKVEDGPDWETEATRAKDAAAPKGKAQKGS